MRIILTLIVGVAWAQTLPTGVGTPGVNSPKTQSSPTPYLKVGYSLAGLRVLEPILALGNIVEARNSSGGLTLQGVANCPACTPTLSGSGWVTLSKASPQPSGSDPWVGWEEWCGVVGPGSLGAWVQAQVTLTQVPSGGLSAASWVFTEEGIVNNPTPSQVTPGLTSVSPPAWIKGRASCLGGGSLMLLPTQTAFNLAGITPPIPTYLRTSVQVVVVQ